MEKWLFMELEVVSTTARRLKNDVMQGRVVILVGWGDVEGGQHYLWTAFDSLFRDSLTDTVVSVNNGYNYFNTACVYWWWWPLIKCHTIFKKPCTWFFVLVFKFLFPDSINVANLFFFSVQHGRWNNFCIFWENHLIYLKIVLKSLRDSLEIFSATFIN